jgi:hypothetical protein
VLSCQPWPTARPKSLNARSIAVASSTFGSPRRRRQSANRCKVLCGQCRGGRRREFSRRLYWRRIISADDPRGNGANEPLFPCLFLYTRAPPLPPPQTGARKCYGTRVLRFRITPSQVDSIRKVWNKRGIRRKRLRNSGRMHQERKPQFRHIPILSIMFVPERSRCRPTWSLLPAEPQSHASRQLLGLQTCEDIMTIIDPRSHRIKKWHNRTIKRLAWGVSMGQSANGYPP